ncbi:hypothetical protein ACJJTC_006155 [Scirpophaga incertulas]
MIYTVRKFLRLNPRQCILIQKCMNHDKVSSNLINTETNESDNNNIRKDLQVLLQKYQDKITFNSYLEKEKLKLGDFKYHLKKYKKAKKKEILEFKNKSLPSLPVALQYIVNKEDLLTDDTNENNLEVTNEVFQLPFAQTTNISVHKSETESSNPPVSPDNDSEFEKLDINKWMTDYEHFNDANLEDTEEIDDWTKQYGTPDPSLGISMVPCGGCGALLHSSDPAIPGYLPSEIFRGRSNDELKTIECQRCHFLREYNIALDVTVHHDEYEKLLQSIRYVKSLVILMVDLLDFPCSIWPGIVDIIGTDRPIIIVANKVDLLPRDSYGYLNRVKECLVSEIMKTKLGEAKIKQIFLISAKTGYGVEELVSFMFKEWLYKGDVFLVGSTNVGKSSLFNALLQSDYCKVHAVDIIKRATVSRWPGTTLNLLKFPINRPSGWKIAERTRRLKSEARLKKMEEEIRKAQEHGKPHADAPLLIGHIGRTFSIPDVESLDFNKKQKMEVLNEKDKLFVKSKWLYDTPGVILPDQVLGLLSTEELLLTIPKKMLRPQTYYLDAGYSLFVGGLARVDVVESAHACRLTVFCAEGLPITVTRTEHADEVYAELAGTELLGVPRGGAARLAAWPGLQRARELFWFEGAGPKACCGDLVLSSAGWVAVTAKGGERVAAAAWSPDARGVRRRCPSLLPRAVTLKGKRLRHTPAYMPGNPFTDKH